ncbi:MAG: hypothetical protein OEL20_05105 [Sulfuritalea sp.]|nr:hypothetical protein [Sulfuritalea sp.]
MREYMNKAGISSVRELHRRVKAIDPGAVNHARFSRIIDVLPSLINPRTLVGLSLALDCKICDLLHVRKDIEKRKE